MGEISLPPHPYAAVVLLHAAIQLVRLWPDVPASTKPEEGRPMRNRHRNEAFCQASAPALHGPFLRTKPSKQTNQLCPTCLLLAAAALIVTRRIPYSSVDARTEGCSPALRCDDKDARQSQWEILHAPNRTSSTANQVMQWCKTVRISLQLRGSTETILASDELLTRNPITDQNVSCGPTTGNTDSQCDAS
eukprot:scpid28288/ scgid28137/ 